jgi:DNA gyrase subunit A
VVGFDVVAPKAEVLILTDQGMGKRTPAKDFPTQGRYGVGVTAGALAGKQRIAGALAGDPSDRVTVITSKGGGRPYKLDAAGRRGRAARGSHVVKLKSGDMVLRLVPWQAAFSLPEEEAPAPARAKSNGRANGHAKAARGAKAAKKAPARAPAKNGKRGKQRRK